MSRGIRGFSELEIADLQMDIRKVEVKIIQLEDLSDAHPQKREQLPELYKLRARLLKQLNSKTQLEFALG